MEATIVYVKVRRNYCCSSKIYHFCFRGELSRKEGRIGSILATFLCKGGSKNSLSDKPELWNFYTVYKMTQSTYACISLVMNIISEKSHK